MKARETGRFQVQSLIRLHAGLVLFSTLSVSGRDSLRRATPPGWKAPLAAAIFLLALIEPRRCHVRYVPAGPPVSRVHSQIRLCRIGDV